MEGRSIDRELLWRGAKAFDDQCDLLIIEGAGGLFSPLAGDMLNVGLIHQLMPCRLIVVAANQLGTIHQTLATCLAAGKAGLHVDGIILSDTTERLDESAAT